MEYCSISFSIFELSVSFHLIGENFSYMLWKITNKQGTSNT